MAAENNRHLNTTPGLEASPLEFTTRRNETRPKRGSNLMKEKLILLQKHPLTL